MIIGLVLAPLLAAVAALLHPRSGAVIGGATAALNLGFGIPAAISVWRDGEIEYALGGWAVPLGIALRLDGLSAVMILMTGSVVLPVVVYAWGYFRCVSEGRSRFWPLALLLVGALNAIFLSRDIFNLYVTLELVTLAGVALVVVSEDTSALFAGIRYLLAAFVASMVFLLGVAILYGAYGVLDLDLLGEQLIAEPASIVAVALIVVGLLLKTAVFPLHFWLPRAHSAAPAPVSALLSALVVTGSFYILLRLWSGPFISLVSASAGQLFGWLGTAAIVWGSVQALRQQHLKVMIAYSTVAQVGYLLLLFPMISGDLGGAEWSVSAWNGGVYHALSHALAKAAMFLAAGTIAFALGDDRIVGISGIARQLPVTTYAFGIAGMTLIGLPPSGGFVAKWLLLGAAISSGQWWWAVTMLVGGILTAGYIFLVLGQELSLATSDREVELRKVPRTMEFAPMALALMALVLGVRVTEPAALLTVGFPLGGG